MRGCRKLHNVELHNLYTSQNNIRIIKPRMMRGVQYIACMGEIIHAHKISVGKPEWKRPLGRPRHTWEYNIRIDLQETGWEHADWIHLI